MKRKLIFIFALFLIFLLVSCSSDSKGDNNKSEKEEAISFVFAFTNQMETPQHDGALKFKELVEEYSEGQLEVDIKPAGQLGDEVELIEAVQAGTIEGIYASTAELGNLSSALQLPDLPFLVNEKETMYELLDGEIGDELLATLDESGLKGTAFWESGFKQLTSNKEIESPKDFEGLQFRTMPSPIIIDTYEALGANAVPISFSEVYTALQQGVVDGQENPLASIYSMNFYEVQDYMTIANIAYLGYIVNFNKEWFDSLSEDLQNVLVKSSREAATFERQAVADAEKDYLNDIEESGTIINELTEEQLLEFKKATEHVHDNYKEDIGSEIMEQTYQLINDIEK